MRKTVWKLRPHDYWRIGELESWLSDMASKGLHVKKMGTPFVQFEKGQPKKMKYRIEVSMEKTISNEQIEVYEEAGWSYVTSFQFFDVFSSPEQLHALELHTDPAEQAFTLEQLNKRLIFNTVLTVTASLLMFGMVASIIFLDGTPLLKIVEDGAFQQILLLMIIIFLATSTLRAAISIHRLRRSLIEGKAINHQAPWKKGYWINVFSLTMFTAVIVLNLIASSVQLVNNNVKTLPKGEIDLPAVRLSHIEQNPSMIRDVYMIDGVDWANHYSSSWSFLAPIQYEVTESAIVPGERWPDGSGEYSPSISVKVFQLRWAALSKGLLDDLVKWHSYEDSPAFTEVQHAALDKLVVQEELYYKQIIAAKGKAVMYVRYDGHANLDQIVENMVQKIILLEEDEKDVHSF